MPESSGEGTLELEPVDLWIRGVEVRSSAEVKIQERLVEQVDRKSVV